ncbi:MAG TPA: hypothetical protein VJ598_10645 [Albitalea sp.]|nr:hypothetical protein [Albitalea sp.]
MKTSERITRVADQIEAVLDANPSSRANPEAMAQLLAAAAELSGGDAYASGKLVELVAKAQVFYGPRSRFRLPGRSQGLWSEMREALLDRLRMRARVLASQGD